MWLRRNESPRRGLAGECRWGLAGEHRDAFSLSKMVNAPEFRAEEEDALTRAAVWRDSQATDVRTFEILAASMEEQW